MSPGPRTLTPGDAAAILGLHLSRLRQLEADGTLRAERDERGHRRYTAASVHALALVRERTALDAAVRRAHA